MYDEGSSETPVDVVMSEVGGAESAIELEMHGVKDQPLMYDVCFGMVSSHCDSKKGYIQS